MYHLTSYESTQIPSWLQLYSAQKKLWTLEEKNFLRRITTATTLSCLEAKKTRRLKRQCKCWHYLLWSISKNRKKMTRNFSSFQAVVVLEKLKRFDYLVWRERLCDAGLHRKNARDILQRESVSECPRKVENMLLITAESKVSIICW